MTASPLAVETQGAIRLIRLGADGHIFLTNRLCLELEAALSEASADTAVRAVVVTGANPGCFMRHYSVAEILAISAQLTAAGVRPGDEVPHNDSAIDRCIKLAESMEKPVIAAINGECMGGAMEFALGCDMRVAQAGPYRLGQPETLLGILPGAGGTQRLARIVGHAAAMELAVLGVPVTPEEAHRIGLVHRVVPDALSEAMALAAHAARLPARAVAYTKRLVNEARTTPLPDGLKRERALFLDLALRPEGIATMQAYEAGRHGFALRDGRWQVTMPLIILPGDFADPQVIALLHLHLNDAHDKSPPGTSYALDLSGLQVPEISFFAAWEGGRLAGIGALKTLSADWVEIKSMRTHPDFLRRGVAAAMLTHLLDEARRRGCKRVSLETGDHANFGPAIALYERFGFRFGEQFGDYVPSPFNQFMHLAL